jgi:hypothetical protein
MKTHIITILLILITLVVLFVNSFMLGQYTERVDAVKHKMGYWKVSDYGITQFCWSTNLLIPEVLK